MAAEANARHRVLVVDDDAAVRGALAQVLGEADFHVATARDAAGALRAAEQEPFAAVICDRHLPDGSGIDVLKALAERRPALVRRFVLVSGDPSDPDVRAFAALRPARVLRKPFSNAALLRCVAAIVDADLPVAPSL